MRSPGRGLDPRINIYDMSSDAVRYASMRMGLVQDTLDDMGPQAIDDGLSYQELYDGMGTMLSEWGRAAAVVSRYIGGVYVDRSMKGQTGAGAPFTPVPLERQQQAMDVLTQQVFAPDVFRVSPELLRYTAQQRRGFSGSQDPRLHDALLAMHRSVLDHLMHPTVLRRITDSGLYGNEYGLGQMMTDLTTAIFAADRKGDVNAMRQNLQVEYVQRLAKLAQGNGTANGYHSPAVSVAIYQLGQIQRLLDRAGRADLETTAHRQNLDLLIQRALAVPS
ncbi:MAG: zinc-dependent metalloprotease, partial [Xanthomonadales bacterium]|nr:zinc-dependent metalloprotease [Xanthomonadales bacterium]